MNALHEAAKRIEARIGGRAEVIGPSPVGVVGIVWRGEGPAQAVWGSVAADVAGMAEQRIAL